MKYYSVLIISLVGILLLSGFFGPNSKKQAEAHLCFTEPEAGSSTSFTVHCESGQERMLIFGPDECTHCSGYDNQQLPSVINLMINPSELNTTQTLKVTNLGNGTTLINVVNATK